MFISIAINVGLSLLSAGLNWLMSDPDREPFKGPWSGDARRYRPVEGDPIPVIFGTVDVAPAVVWSGDIIEVPGESSRAEGVTSNVGWLNALPVHWVVASGPVDKIREVHLITSRESALTLHGASNPSEPLILNGPGGGTQNGVDVKWLPKNYFGDPATDHIPHSLEVRVLPGLQTSGLTGFANKDWFTGSWGDIGFRHVTSMAGLIIADSSYYFDNSSEGSQMVASGATPGSLRMRVTRIFSRSEGLPSWYDEKAAGPNGLDMNPVHAIYEILTDKIWGPTHLDVSELDDASFRAAADIMHEEGIFISARLTASTDTAAFLAQLFSICNASPYQEPTTGKYCIAIATDGYNTNALPVFDDTNSTGEMTRQYAKDMTTRMTVTYTKRYVRQSYEPEISLPPDKEQTFSQTHAAGYHRHGEVELTHDYREIYLAGAAAKLASRDLLQSSRPLASLSVSTNWGNSAARALRPGSPFIWGSAIAGLPEVVYRVTAIDFGNGQSNEIRIEAIEDAFSFPNALEPNIPDTEWSDPTRPPEPATPRVAFQLPLWLWYQLDLENNPYAQLSDHADDGSRPYGLAAGRPNADARDYALHTDGVTRQSGQHFTRFFTTSAPIAQGDNEIALAEETASLNYGAGVVPIILVAGELMEVHAWDPVTNVASVCRGWLDTVPRFATTPSGTDVAVLGALYDGGNRFTRFYSTDNRLSGGTVEIQALTRTSTGTLRPEHAPTDTLDMLPWRDNAVLPRTLLPLAPAYVRASSPIPGRRDVLLEWVVRDRLGSPMCDSPSAPKAPYGFTYSVEVYQVSGGALVRTTTAIADHQWFYTQTMQAADGIGVESLIFVVWAVDGSGRESWQKYIHKLER